MIDKYEFGRIMIDGREYDQDIIIFPHRIQENWRRKDGHNLCLDDLNSVLKANPKTLIIGTGAMGAMKVPDNIKKPLEEMGIKIIIKKTSEAVEEYNRLEGNRIAALHLTC